MISNYLLESIKQACPHLKIILNIAGIDTKNNIQKNSLPMLEIHLLSNERFVYENELIYPRKQVFQLIITTENKKSNPQLDHARELARQIETVCRDNANEQLLYHTLNCIPIESENPHEAKCCFTLIERDLLMERFS